MKFFKMKMLMLVLTLLLYFGLTAVATQIVTVTIDPDWLVRLVMVGVLILTTLIMFGGYRLAKQKDVDFVAFVFTTIFIAALMKMVVGAFDGEFSIAYGLLLVGFGVFYFQQE